MTLAAFAADPPPPQPPDDPFRYLEDSSDPRTEAFYRNEGARARAALDALPERGAIADRIRALSESMASVSGIQLAAGRVFPLTRPSPPPER